MIKNIKIYIYTLLAVLVLFNSCKKEYETIENIDDAKIQTYIKQNNIPAVKDASGFYYQVLEQGTGEPMLNKDSVFYTMTIKSLAGQVYYTTAANTSESGYLGYVAPDPYRLALNAINRGGKVRAIVPSYLAFGKNGNDLVPPNEVIVTELTVNPEKTQWEIDDRLIRGFLTSKGLTATKHPSRVYYNISTAGSGEVINPLSTIKVKYTGRLLTGYVFDQSAGDTTYDSSLYDNIAGWRKVLVGLTKGTKVRIYIPSDLAYGTTSQTTIPSNSILDFDIEIVDVVN